MTRTGSGRRSTGDGRSLRSEFVQLRRTERKASAARTRGTRFRHPASLQEAVLQQCRIELRERWPKVDPEQVASSIKDFVPEVEWDRDAKHAIGLLREALVACTRALKTRPSRNRPFGLYGRMMSCLRESITDYRCDLIAARNSEVWIDPERYVNGCASLLPSEAFDTLDDPRFLAGPLLTRRQLVVLLFLYKNDVVAGPDSGTPSARDLAVLSLLAGEELPPPGSKGLTVFEVINKETKAMREVVRSLRPALEGELETLGFVTERLVRRL